MRSSRAWRDTIRKRNESYDAVRRCETDDYARAKSRQSERSAAGRWRSKWPNLEEVPRHSCTTAWGLEHEARRAKSTTRALGVPPAQWTCGPVVRERAHERARQTTRTENKVQRILFEVLPEVRLVVCGQRPRPSTANHEKDHRNRSRNDEQRAWPSSRAGEPDRDPQPGRRAHHSVDGVVERRRDEVIVGVAVQAPDGHQPDPHGVRSQAPYRPVKFGSDVERIQLPIADAPVRSDATHQNGDAWVRVGDDKDSARPKKCPRDILEQNATESPRTTSVSRSTRPSLRCPAYFDDVQRQATKDAGKIAGLDDPRRS